MAEGEMRHRPEQYEETVDPKNPPGSAGPAVVVAGMWYILAPLVLLLVVIGLALLYWARGDRNPEDAVAPTTGTQEEQMTPGGGDPMPRPTDPEEEREFRGDR